MIELQDSIKKYGVLNPLIVRPKIEATTKLFLATEENMRLRSWDIRKFR